MEVKEKMYNVLVFGMTENPGGIETVIMDYYQKLQDKKIHFDFLCNTKKKVAYEKNIKKMNSKVYKITARSENFYKYRRELLSFFKEHASEYDCIWVNVNSLVNIDYLIMAKKFGIKKRIIHSHNSRMMEKGMKATIKKEVHLLNKIRIKNYATNFWACSTAAAVWFYPTKLLKKVQIIKNAIDTSKFTFNIQKQRKIRKEYNLENSLVIGNVGRLQLQKNQKFCIKILKKLVKINPNVNMIFVGDGPDRSKLANLVNEYKLNSNVRFVGIQNDIDRWLSSFDVFLFPSLFEGLPLALLEAQANGLPIIASKDAIPSDVKINENVDFIYLNEDISRWIKCILKAKRESNTDIIYKNFCKAGYELDTAAKDLEKKFINN